MTPQQQYPKFYSHPERYLGIEVECIKPWQFTNKEYDVFKIGTPVDFTLFLLTRLTHGRLEEYFKPLFKPQQGEQFIKDLEDAVSCGGDGDFKLLSDKLNYKWFIADADGNFHTHLFVTIKDDNLGAVSSYAGDKDMENVTPRNFDTAAYVDRMRELGYYL